MDLQIKWLGRVDYAPTYAAMQAFSEQRGPDTPRRGDVLARAALPDRLEMSDGCLQFGDPLRLEQVALMVEDLPGLFGQVTRLPIAPPEYVAEW